MTRVLRAGRRLPWFLAAGLALAVAIGPTKAQAQDATFADATGWIWGVATLEVTLGAGLLVMAAGDSCHSWGCGVLAMLIATGATAVGLITGIVAGVLDAPPDIPFILHQTLWGGLTGAVGSGGFVHLFGGSHSTAWATAISASGVLGLGLGTYSFVRRDELMRERRTAGAAHFLTWGVMGAGLLAELLCSSLDASGEVSSIVFALTTVVAYGLGIAWAELQIAKGDGAPVAAPLLGWSTAF